MIARAIESNSRLLRDAELTTKKKKTGLLARMKTRMRTTTVRSGQFGCLAIERRPCSRSTASRAVTASRKRTVTARNMTFTSGRLTPKRRTCKKLTSLRKSDTSLVRFFDILVFPPFNRCVFYSQNFRRGRTLDGNNSLVTLKPFSVEFDSAPQ